MNKILIVDDEERITEVLERFLKMKGFDVAKATGGEEAIRILSTDMQLALMVIDIKMPRVSGMDVIRRKKELGREFPVLLFTGSIDAQKYLDELVHFGIGAEDILVKPVDLQVLLEKIKQKLNESPDQRSG